VRLSAVRLNAHLAQMGQALAWRRSYPCPCRDPYSGAAAPGCQACAGNGRTWDVALDGYAGISGLKVQREWAQFGLWQSGDVVVSLPSDSPVYAMGEGDRVALMDSSEPFATVLVRGATDERLAFPVVAVEAVRWLDQGATVTGGIPRVAADGTLSWIARAPSVGAQYSVAGRRRPEYFVWGELPQDRAHHGGEALPRRVVLRRWDLYGR
jgi:hypothetical protein